MNKKKSPCAWKKIRRLLTFMAAVVLLCMSAAAVLTGMGIPWQNWLTDKAKGVMDYIELDKGQLPGSVMTVSTGDIRQVEWTGKQEAVISGSDVALMSEPDSASDIVCKMDGDKKAVLIEQKGNWYRLRYSCYTGWVPLSFVTATGERAEYDRGALEKERAGHARDAADVSAAVSDSDTARQLDRIAGGYAAVGAQVAVIKNGEVVYVHSYGYANRGDGKVMTDDTKIRVASLSKIGVAMAAAVMAEEGIVDLDADISDYLGFTVRNPQYPESPITLRHLLTHTSSLRLNIESKDDYDSFVKKLGKPSSFSARWEPGNDRVWSYSNSGVCLAGMTLEAAAGVTLIDFINEYFFDTMGIDASYYPANISDKELIADLYSSSVSLARSAERQLDQPYSRAGTNFRLYAGNLTISAKDLAKLICVLAGDGTYDGMYYMSPETVDVIQQGYISRKDFNQCLIVRRKEDLIDGRTLYYHTGSAYGTLAFACYDDETRDGVVIITTGARKGYMKEVYSICYNMADHIFTTIL